MRLSLICLSILFMIASCGGSKTVEGNSKTEKEMYLLIGQGGGFTGAYDEYILYPDGRVEVWDEKEQESVFKGNISKTEASAIFESWAKLSDLQVPAGKPGNMNYRIGFHTNGTVKTFSWSDNQNIDASISEFYNNTFQLLRQAE